MRKTRKYHSFPVFNKRKTRYPVPKRRVKAINMEMRMDMLLLGTYDHRLTIWRIEVISVFDVDINEFHNCVEYPSKKPFQDIFNFFFLPLKMEYTLKLIIFNKRKAWALIARKPLACNRARKT